MTFTQRILRPVADVRQEEGASALMMFGYSFLAMTAYNIVQPITRSRYITSLGAENIPYVLLVSALIIGLVMQGYSRLGGLLPGRWIIPATQAGMVGLLVIFWALFAAGQQWVDVLFYLFGQIYGILLISQFWTLANLIYDPRAAKRLFGLIGGGATAGGALGASIAAFFAEEVGSRELVLVSAAFLLGCAALVVVIIRRAGHVDFGGLEKAGREQGVGGAEALRMLRESRHLQVIALTIALMSIGAGLIDQQLNMATEAFKGRDATDAMTGVLARVQVYVSAIGFVIQVWLTSRIHRLLGVGFALLILPFGLGSTGVIILLNAALWAPVLARVLDKSLRYTVDKTSREVLFLPLPPGLKQKAKPFVDVTVDRAARAVSALLLLLLIKPWGLSLNWQQVSYASLVVMGLWIGAAVRAKRGYVAAFRQGIEQGIVRPEEVRLSGAELATIETLVEELSHPDPVRVVHAIDVLESLDKRNLVTPLLLHHESAAVRRRALAALGAVRSDIAVQWVPHIRRLLGDEDAGVRGAAIGALGAICCEDAAALARPMLVDPDPRIRVTAAVALAASAEPGDVDLAEKTLVEISADVRDGAGSARRDVAAAVRQIADPRFRRLLIPLLYDPAPEVAEEAMESVRAAGTADFIFVPPLVALLRHRQLKGPAREVLVGYGEPAVEALAYFMHAEEEDVWVRRHIPATLARIPTQRTVDVLTAALEERDAFLRHKVITALGRLRREAPGLTFSHEPIERRAVDEGRGYFGALSLADNLFRRATLPADSPLGRALAERMAASKDRIYRLLSLVYPWQDIAAAQWTLEHGDGRSRASASEYLDNVLAGPIRRWIMPILEDLPPDEKVRRGNALLRTHPRDVEETLLHLIHDEDQVVAAAAIDLVRECGIWNLAEDIEYVLAHRDAADWYVFEAASWALAERRVSAARRRALWLEPLPAVALAATLRRLPLFASVSVDELFRIAGAGRQIRHEPGTVLVRGAGAGEHVHLLLDGRVTATRGAAAPETIEAPAALGLAEALQGLSSRETLRAADGAVTLALTSDELRTLLADNTDLVRGLFLTIADRLEPVALAAGGAAAGGTELTMPAGGEPTPVEKVLALQRVPLFAHVSADQMPHLAAVARTQAMTAGSTLFSPSAPPAIWLLLSGEVALEHPARGLPAVARAGDVIGMHAAMAGRPLGRSAGVVRDGVALRLDHDGLFDVIEAQPKLLRQMFKGIFGIQAEAPRMQAS